MDKPQGSRRVPAGMIGKNTIRIHSNAAVDGVSVC